MMPPRFMLSTADDGTITMEPFSLDGFVQHVHGPQVKSGGVVRVQR
ncbi:MAG: hypothetical protein JWP08_183 [Bryobacterales bacterium]|nr:hypothetical protein [Bryobacterales bacterium]